MKKILLLMASVLLFSCNNSTLLTNGTYKVTSETSLVVNGVDAYYLDYSQAEIVFTGINGNAGTMTLNNIVTGQPSVTIHPLPAIWVLY